MATLHELCAAGRRRLRDAGLRPADADLDARVLLERILHWDAARLFAHGVEEAPEAVARRYAGHLDRRVRHEPVAYITGQQEFWGLTFEVTPAVLIPRPETEIALEAALAAAPDRHAPLRVADVCTGSGCLAVAFAVERPGALVVATDLSAEALSVARRNASRHGVGDRVVCRQTDLLQGEDGPFDLILANPPYVPTVDEATMQPDVVRFEPHLALFGGADGLAVIRPLLPQAADRLAAGGALILEFGYGQAGTVERLIAETPGLVLAEIRPDLQGIPRTAVARRLASGAG